MVTNGNLKIKNMVLDLQGSLEISIFENGIEISEEKEKEVINKLNNGKLYFSLYSKNIVNEDFNEIYTIDYEINTNMEYNFE